MFAWRAASILSASALKPPLRRRRFPVCTGPCARQETGFSQRIIGAALDCAYRLDRLPTKSEGLDTEPLGCLRRAPAVEIHEDWIEAHRYMNMEMLRGIPETKKMKTALEAMARQLPEDLRQMPSKVTDPNWLDTLEGDGPPLNLSRLEGLTLRKEGQDSGRFSALSTSRLTLEFTSMQIVFYGSPEAHSPAIRRSDASVLARYSKMTKSLVVWGTRSLAFLYLEKNLSFLRRADT
jgi:hypothetical protein